MCTLGKCNRLSLPNVSSLATGPVFGNMNLFTGMGVFVDTYPNEDKSHEVCCVCLSAQNKLGPAGNSTVAKAF